MTRRDSVPEFTSPVFRDVATSERTSVVWRRLHPQLPVATKRTRRAAPLVWSAAVAAAFIGGVWVGEMRATGPVSVVVASSPREPEAATSPFAPVAAPPRAEVVRAIADPVALATGRPLRAWSHRLAALDPSATSPGASAPSSAPSAGPVSPEWERLVELGEFDEARRSLALAGGPDGVLVSGQPSQLMALADLARFQGQSSVAVAAWRGLLDRFPADGEAPIAAFYLGNALKRAGDLRGAMAAFARYRTLSPDGEFREDALVRQIESAMALGASAQLDALAGEYATEFPSGSRKAEFSAARAAALARGGRSVAASPLPEPGDDAGSAPRAGGGARPATAAGATFPSTNSHAAVDGAATTAELDGRVPR